MGTDERAGELVLHVATDDPGMRNLLRRRAAMLARELAVPMRVEFVRAQGITTGDVGT